MDQKRRKELVEYKRAKLKEQKELARKFHEHLNSSDGLIENSRRVCRNLDAAVVASKRPGYFKYYDPTERVKRVEERGTFKQLTGAIKRVQDDLDKADAELAVLERKRKAALEGPPPEIGTLAQWFNTYGGKPKQIANGMTSTFTDNPKVYGGTRHSPAFKSVAKTLTKGRCTK